jgi:uncharacterized membrane protein YccF (DUF307 family)
VIGRYGGGIALWLIIFGVILALAFSQYELVKCVVLAGIWIEMVHTRLDRRRVLDRT